jgi:hypothetical protein
LVQGGEDEITLEGLVPQHTEIEHHCVVGDFGVAATPMGRSNRIAGQTSEAIGPQLQLTGERATLRSGDLVPQGCPFYAGSISLIQSLHLPTVEGRVFLKFDRGELPPVKVIVNGQTGGVEMWPPHDVEITHLLHEGENSITLKLVSSLRNLLGPHHQERDDKPWTGPSEFRSVPDWIDDYWIAPLGTDEVRLLAETKEGRPGLGLCRSGCTADKAEALTRPEGS